MTNVFAVVGEHRAEPERLLLLGDDGRYYAFAAEGRPAEVEPSGAWRLDDGPVSAARSRKSTTRPGHQEPRQEPRQDRE